MPPDHRRGIHCRPAGHVGPGGFKVLAGGFGNNSFVLCAGRWTSHQPPHPLTEVSLRLVIRFLVAVTVVATIACASTGGTKGRSDFISASEINTSGAATAWDAVQRIQPHWLRSGNIGSIGAGGRDQIILVYLDGHRLGDIGSLRTLSTSGIISMQWLDAARAAAVLPEIGSDPIGGAIVIKTH